MQINLLTCCRWSVDIPAWDFFTWRRVALARELAVTHFFRGAGIARSGESARLPPMWPGFDSGQVSYVG